MEQLQTIEGFNAKVYGTQEQPLFLAKEVAELIEHTKTSNLLRTIDVEEKEAHIVSTPGGEQEMWFLTEDGLYEVLMTSRKPIAKQFKKKVKQVIKDIRKHGMYANDNLLDDPDLLLKTITKYKEEREKVLALQTENAVMQPKALMADVITASDESITVGAFAKILAKSGYRTGQQRLFEELRRQGYLISRKGRHFNNPKQQYIEQGLFDLDERPYFKPNGETEVSVTTLITGKGQQYFINKFIGNNEVGA